jgi:hypothetical protein
MEADAGLDPGDAVEALGVGGLPEPGYFWVVEDGGVVAGVLGLVGVAVLHRGHAADVAHLPGVLGGDGGVAFYCRVHATPRAVGLGNPVVVHE